MLADAVRDKAALADLNRLAEEWVLPISPTHRRPQLFDATHPNYGGYMGIRVPPDLIGEMKKADLMVALGERMTDTVSQSYTFPEGADAATCRLSMSGPTRTRSAASGAPISASRRARTRSSRLC